MHYNNHDIQEIDQFHYIVNTMQKECDHSRQFHISFQSSHTCYSTTVNAKIKEMPRLLFYDIQWIMRTEVIHISPFDTI